MNRSHKICWDVFRASLVAAFGLLLLLWLAVPVANAGPLITQQGTTTVTATVLPTTPTTPAVILSPIAGTHFATTPLVANGTCGIGLLVRMYDNGQLAGSINCDTNGTYIMNLNLIVGTNALTALNFDAFDQPGPALPAITVYVDAPTVTPNTTASPTTPASTETPGSADTTPAPNPFGSGSGPQLLFAGTFVEPLVKAMNIGITVSPGVNSAVTVATNGVFLLSAVLLISLVLL